MKYIDTRLIARASITASCFSRISFGERCLPNRLSGQHQSGRYIELQAGRRLKAIFSASSPSESFLHFLLSFPFYFVSFFYFSPLTHSFLFARTAELSETSRDKACGLAASCDSEGGLIRGTRSSLVSVNRIEIRFIPQFPIVLVFDLSQVSRTLGEREAIRLAYVVCRAGIRQVYKAKG